jgi:isoquinoline 1-oxidoreductase beta subunit
VCWIFPRRPLPSGFLPLGGVAVIVGNTWAAMQGRQSLQIQWEPGPNADYNTTAYRTDTGGDRAAAGQGGEGER